MKKKIKRYILLMFTILFITSCSAKPEPKNKGEGLTILTSFYPIYLHTINITKDIDGVEVLNMTQPQTGCLHDYQLSPDNLKTLEESQVFIINGAGMEGFMDKVLSQMPELTIINASENIDLLEGEDGHEANPHVWVSISAAIKQVDHIARDLAKLDPDKGDLYLANADIYISKLEELKEEMHERLDKLPNKNIITFHEAFPYFAQEFDLNIVGTIIEETNNEPSAKQISEIIELIKEHKVRAIFAEPQFSSKSPDLISKESGVSLYTLDPIASATDSTMEEDDYINKMKANLQVLEEALR